MIKHSERFAVMEMFEIEKVVKENDSNKTFYLKEFIDCVAGQFMMVWIQGIDEKPFSLMNFENKSAINLEVKGKWSKIFFKMEKGEKIGLRGPFGKGFSFSGVKKACIVAGGVGVVPLLSLNEKLKKANIKTTFILGAKTKKRVLFVEKLKRNSDELIITTDDGSYGIKAL